MGKAKDITGLKFNRLLVISREPNQDTHSMWKCRCDCGNLTIVAATKLKTGKTKSCGCLGPELSRIQNKKHGQYGTRLYTIWKGMKTRCYNKNDHSFNRYGGRGIKICDEWKDDFMSFYTWSMENGYMENLTIERIDYNGNYEPSNCRWATKKEQANNRSSNHILAYKGQEHTIAEWSIITGLNKRTIRDRISKGWSIEDALTIPKIEKKGVKHDKLQFT